MSLLLLEHKTLFLEKLIDKKLLGYFLNSFLFIFTDNILKMLPVLRMDIYNFDKILLIPSNLIIQILFIVKYHFNQQFKILSCVTGIDFPKNKHRFQAVYDLLSIKYNS